MSEPFWSEPTEASRAMNALITGAARRSQGHTLGAVPPEHDRNSAALSEWERVKHLPDDSDEKMFAAIQLEQATKAAEQARLHPRNPDGTYASFDGGARRTPGQRRPTPGLLMQETANQLFARALSTHRRESDEARSDPGHTIIVNA